MCQDHETGEVQNAAIPVTITRFGNRQAAPAKPCMPRHLWAVVGAWRHREPAALGAKLGAILCGLVWTAVDACGIESLCFRPVWTVVDACGHGLEIYGSGGWGFEFLRACRLNPLQRKGFRWSRAKLDDLWSVVGPHLVRKSTSPNGVERYREGLHVGREEVPVAVHRHRDR